MQTLPLKYCTALREWTTTVVIQDYNFLKGIFPPRGWPQPQPPKPTALV
uniref:Uncharacterized protein n=1 Tax=Anguilla anguilla TaxID=7936 RepID=A0A0E9VMR3_ANGAN